MQALIEDHAAEMKKVTQERDSYKTQLQQFHADRDIELDIDFVPDDDLTANLNNIEH
jgi:hypothetical protein